MIRPDAAERRARKLALFTARDRSWSALPTHTYEYIRYADRTTVATIEAKTMVEADAKLLIETGINAVTTPSIGCVRQDSADEAKTDLFINKDSDSYKLLMEAREAASYINLTGMTREEKRAALTGRPIDGDAKNLAIENTAFLIESVEQFDPTARTIATDMPFDEVLRRFCR